MGEGGGHLRLEEGVGEGGRNEALLAEVREAW